MKILFESVNGKKGTKEFKTLSEAKSFVIKNKNVIKEAQIMEGPLGSGGWTPKKAWNQFKKGHEKMANMRNTDKTKDSYDNNIFDYLVHIASDAGKDFGLNYFGAGRDKHGYYISSITPAFKKFEDEDNADRVRQVNSESEKYGRKIYMPKLTKYIETHDSLPSIKQVREYMRKLIEKRYEQNLNKQKKKNPNSLTAKNDVENF